MRIELRDDARHVPGAERTRIARALRFAAGEHAAGIARVTLILGEAVREHGPRDCTCVLFVELRDGRRFRGQGRHPRPDTAVLRAAGRALLCAFPTSHRTHAGRRGPRIARLALR